jgi:glucan-binding YG repeat protein
VTSIGDSAFYFCENLTDIAIPDGVKYIGISTFGNCSSLTSITIPHSVTSIEPSAFAGCESLADVYYKGTEEQWNLISISNDNDWLLKATIHFLGEPIKKDVYFDLLSGLWLDQNGNPAQGIAVCLDSETRYCHAGKPQRKGAATDPDGYIYYFNSTLKAVRNTTYTIGESMANGIIPAGTYNVDAQGRLMDGRGELLRADTAMADGFKYFADGTIRYYVDGKPARAGLVTDEEGNYYYFNSSLKAVCEAWYEIGENMTNGLLPAGRYYFNKNGRIILP